MVWPQLCLPCLANHKSSTFKQLEQWKIDETAAPRSTNKNRTQQKKTARSERVQVINRGCLSGGFHFITWDGSYQMSTESHYVSIVPLSCSSLFQRLGLADCILMIDWIRPEIFWTYTTYSHRLLSCYVRDYRWYGPVNSTHKGYPTVHSGSLGV